MSAPQHETHAEKAHPDRGLIDGCGPLDTDRGAMTDLSWLPSWI